MITKKKRAVAIYVNFISGEKLIKLYGMDMRAVFDIMNIRYENGRDGNLLDAELKTLCEQYVQLREMDIRCFGNRKVKDLDPGWENLEKGEILTKMLVMQDGLVKKGDQGVDFQEFNEKKICIPMSLTYDGTEEWGVFENALRAYKDLYKIEEEDMIKNLSITLKGKSGAHYQSFLKYTENEFRTFEALMAYLKLRHAKQNISESKREYESRLWKLCAQALGNAKTSVMDKVVKMSFLSGLKNNELRNFLSLRQPKDMLQVRFDISVWKHAKEMVANNSLEDGNININGTVWDSGSERIEGRDPILDAVERQHREFMLDVMTVADSMKRGKVARGPIKSKEDSCVKANKVFVGYRTGRDGTTNTMSDSNYKREKLQRIGKTNLSGNCELNSFRGRARSFPRRDNIESRYRTDSRDSRYESKDRLRDYGKGKYDRTRCIRDYPVVKSRNSRKGFEKQVICYICGDRGHKSIKCPRSRKSPEYKVKRVINCGYCEGVHYRYECPLKKFDTCRNCGINGHHGHECQSVATSNVLGGNNLGPVDRYRDMIQSNELTSSNKNSVNVNIDEPPHKNSECPVIPNESPVQLNSLKIDDRLMGKNQKSTDSDEKSSSNRREVLYKQDNGSGEQKSIDLSIDSKKSGSMEFYKLSISSQQQIECFNVLLNENEKDGIDGSIVIGTGNISTFTSEVNFRNIVDELNTLGAVKFKISDKVCIFVDGNGLENLEDKLNTLGAVKFKVRDEIGISVDGKELKSIKDNLNTLGAVKFKLSSKIYMLVVRKGLKNIEDNLNTLGAVKFKLNNIC